MRLAEFYELTDQSKQIRNSERFIARQRKRGKKRKTAFTIGDRPATPSEERRIMRGMKAQQREYERRQRDAARRQSFETQTYSKPLSHNVAFFSFYGVSL